MNTPISRRALLASAAKLAALSVPPLLLPSLRASAMTPSTANSLVVIFQRGGCDGLNSVVPYRDDDYYAARPTIAIPRPGLAGGASDLDGFFALHPALSGLLDAYWGGHLCLLPAVHYPDAQRSHFEAMNIIESASIADGANRDTGWLGRYLDDAPDPADRLRAVSLATGTHRSLRGSTVVTTLRDLDIPTFGSSAADELTLTTRLQDAYARPSLSSNPIERFVQENGRKLWRDMSSLATLDLPPSSGAGMAGYPSTPLGMALFQSAGIIKRDAGTEIITIDAGGWDTHAAQGGATGRQATLLSELGDALGAFHDDMGTDLSRVLVLVMTEFGRTTRENASGGTDHGGASTWMALGGGVQGGINLGGQGWPGLVPHGLHQSRELQFTVDFRDVMAEVLTRHLGHSALGPILPGFTPTPLGFIT